MAMGRIPRKGRVQGGNGAYLYLCLWAQMHGTTEEGLQRLLNVIWAFNLALFYRAWSL